MLVTHPPTALEPGGPNAVARMLSLLGDEWTMLIIQQCLMGATRYSHFMARLPISNAVLTSRLRALVEAGILTPDYRATERSRSLWPVLVSIWEWERIWVADHAERLPAMRHDGCGHFFSPVLLCSECRGPVGTEDIEWTLGPSGQWERSAPTVSTRRRPGSDATPRQAGLFPETMSVLGNRWAAALLVAAFLGTERFTDFQSQLGIPPSLLAERLQTFCAIGVFATGHGAEYQLTDKGRAFGDVLVTALQWAQRWFRAPEGPAIVALHRACGRPFTAGLVCGHCGDRLAGAQVEVVTSAAVSGIP